MRHDTWKVPDGEKSPEDRTASIASTTQSPRCCGHEDTESIDWSVGEPDLKMSPVIDADIEVCSARGVVDVGRS